MSHASGHEVLRGSTVPVDEACGCCDGRAVAMAVALVLVDDGTVRLCAGCLADAVQLGLVAPTTLTHELAREVIR
jgi:hypothetical protein